MTFLETERSLCLTPGLFRGCEIKTSHAAIQGQHVEILVRSQDAR